MTKNNNKGSAKKKLLPAVAMLTTSAVMLSTSTYAWFTMSREVEVNNIKLTATTPEDIQISLGEITGGNDSDTNLAKSTGTLAASGGVVNAPSDIYDWSNTADIGAYYQFGKLIPASSINGENVYFTPDADGVGKTVKDGAKYYTAVAGSTLTAESTIGSSSKNSLMATAHTLTAEEKSSSNPWTATKSTAWNNTNDDGYYVDIPVWLRTSSTEAQNIYVTGYVTKGSNTSDVDTDDVLYQAVRVAILKDNCTVDGGCLTLADGAKVTANGSATYYGNLTAVTADATKHILDSDNYNNRVSDVSGIKALSATTPTYEAVIINNGTASVANLAAGTGTAYGTATKLIIRVWLEGEDGDCWNENAGQDWAISLKFMKEALS